jgi:hypothetical protein
MSQLMSRCADLLSSLYAPIPEDSEDEDAGDTATYSFNSTSEMERGNRHVRENTLLVFHLARLKMFLPLHNLLHSGYGMRLSRPGTPATVILYQPRMLDCRQVWSSWWNYNWQGKLKKIYPRAFSHGIPHVLGTNQGTQGGKPAYKSITYCTTCYMHSSLCRLITRHQLQRL